MSLKKLSPVYRNKYNFVKENLDTKKIVLDIGCGYGEHINGLPQAFGIDLDKEALNGKTVACADAQNIPFKNNSFEMVICIDVLEHVEDDMKTISEISRVMKKGGKLIFTVPSWYFPATYDPVNAFLRNFNKHVKIGMWGWGHRRLYKKYEVEKLFSDNKLKINKFDQRSHAFVAAFLNYGPYLSAHLFPRLFRKKQKQAIKKENKGKIYKITEKLNIIDQKYFKNWNGVSLCFVAEKI